MKSLLAFVILFTISSIACSKNNNGATTNVPIDNIQVYSYSPNIPVLRDLTTNAIVKLVVSGDAANINKQIKKIQCTLNTAVISDIQKVDVYQTSNDIFSSNTLLTSVSSIASAFDIPVNIDVTQGGLQYIWLSVVLKSNASINNKVELHAIKMIDVSGREITINQGSSNYIKYAGVALRKSGDNGADTYRIPGIINTDKGTLIAVYDIRYSSSADLPAAIDVGMSRSIDSGRTWEPMKVIMHMGSGTQQGIGDPSIFFDPVTIKIWVAALWAANGHSIAQSTPGLTVDVTGQFVLVNSSDDGVTWSTPINITSQVKDPAWKILFQGPGRGIAMADGKLVFPAQYWDASNMPYSTIIYSKDNGTSWQRGVAGAKSNTTESQVVETSPGTLMLNMRDNRGSFRSVSVSTDLGSTWIEHSTSYNTLQDPVCMASLIKANVNVNGAMKDILFFSNPNVSASPRQKITIKASADLGQTWPSVNQVLIDERECYGYSCLTKIDDNTIGILYEGTKELYFIKIPISDLIK